MVIRLSSSFVLDIVACVKSSLQYNTAQKAKSSESIDRPLLPVFTLRTSTSFTYFYNGEYILEETFQVDLRTSYTR